MVPAGEVGDGHERLQRAVAGPGAQAGQRGVDPVHALLDGDDGVRHRHPAVRDGDDAVYVEKLRGHASLPLPSRTGGRAPLT